MIAGIAGIAWDLGAVLALFGVFGVLCCLAERLLAVVLDAAGLMMDCEKRETGDES